jgi:hypothetical protein
VLLLYLQKPSTPPAFNTYRKVTPSVSRQTSLVASAVPEVIQEIHEAPASPRLRNHKELEAAGGKASNNTRVRSSAIARNLAIRADFSVGCLKFTEAFAWHLVASTAIESLHTGVCERAV